MAAKTILVLCAQALLAQLISSQCINAYDGLAWDAAPYAASIGSPWNAAASCAAGAWVGAPYAAAPYATEWAASYAPASLTASNGGGLAVTSASPIPPSGVAVVSDNAYEGALAVSGALPFLGAVTLEGPLPTLGAGAVTYGCGNGNVAILNEDINVAGYGPYGVYGPSAELGYGYASAPLAYETAIAGPAFGYRSCGAIY